MPLHAIAHTSSSLSFTTLQTLKSWFLSKLCYPPTLLNNMFFIGRPVFKPEVLWNLLNVPAGCLSLATWCTKPHAFKINRAQGVVFQKIQETWVIPPILWLNAPANPVWLLLKERGWFDHLRYTKHLTRQRVELGASFCNWSQVHSNARTGCWKDPRLMSARQTVCGGETATAA